MTTRRQMLFEANPKPSQGTSIPATVNFKINKKKGGLKPLHPHEKMLCALRKVLAAMSDKDHAGCRFYIDNNKVQILKAPVGSGGRDGEAQTYKASGRCKLGVCHPEGHKSSKVIQFNITFRDVKDTIGQDDVEFLDDTSIDELPKSTRIL